MRVLPDECVPQRLRHHIVGHEVHTVPDMGWTSKTNGELLRLAEPQFDVFVTTDQRLSYQQNIAGMAIAVVILVAARNKLEPLRVLVPDLLRILPGLKPGEVRRIGG